MHTNDTTRTKVMRGTGAGQTPDAPVGRKPNAAPAKSLTLAQATDLFLEASLAWAAAVQSERVPMERVHELWLLQDRAGKLYLKMKAAATDPTELTAASPAASATPGLAGLTVGEAL